MQKSWSNCLAPFNHPHTSIVQVWSELKTRLLTNKDPGEEGGTEQIHEKHIRWSLFINKYIQNLFIYLLNISHLWTDLLFDHVHCKYRNTFPPIPCSLLSMSILISLFFIYPCSFHFPLATPFCCPSSSPFAPLVTKLDTQILPYAPLSCPRPVRSPLSPVNQSIVILLAKFSSLSNGERERERERERDRGRK